MRLGLVIASYRRSDLLEEALRYLLAQQRIPDDIVLSVVEPGDAPEMARTLVNVQVVVGSAGLTRQRNRGLACLLEKTDAIAFIDDDFIVGDDYFLNLEKIFQQDDSIVAVAGKVIADGANSPGYTFEEGLRLVAAYRQQKKPDVSLRDIEGTYGCNMAFRTARIGSVRFDERLPLYGWQEDLDFSGALRGLGRMVGSNSLWGVHLGTKRGKGGEVRLGYSQVINPAYIARKGNMAPSYAFRLVVKNIIANLIKSLAPESYVDRRGRLRGNLIGLMHLMKGRLTPEYVLELE